MYYEVEHRTIHLPIIPEKRGSDISIGFYGVLLGVASIALQVRVWVRLLRLRIKHLLPFSHGKTQLTIQVHDYKAERPGEN